MSTLSCRQSVQNVVPTWYSCEWNSDAADVSDVVVVVDGLEAGHPTAEVMARIGAPDTHTGLVIKAEEEQNVVNVTKDNTNGSRKQCTVVL